MTAPGTIQITPDEMRTHAKTFDTARGNVEQLLAQLNRTVQSMQGRWAGQAYQRFESLWPGHQKEMQSLMTDLQDVSQQLQNTATQLQTADQQAASRMR